MSTNEKLERQAYDMGYQHGRNAGGWVTDGNTTTETYRALLAGLEEGDPEVLGGLPTAPLSGEWAGDPTPASVLEDLDLEDDGMGRYDFILDQYEMGFADGVEHEVTATCRRMLSED